MPDPVIHVPVKQHKKLIRQQVRQIRNQINGKQAQQAAQKLVEQLKSNEDYIKAKRIACFISFDGEISTRLIIDMILQDKGLCFLPKLRPTKPNRLWFMPYTSDSKLVNNRLSIPEVDLPVNHALAVSKLDIILMPLVAFDKQGNRLGMGGGFYDATLAHLSKLTKLNNQRRPKCIGIAYQQQMVDQIPTQEWDFALDGALTQDALHWFSKE